MNDPQLYECLEAVQTAARPSAPPVVVGTGTRAEMERLVSLGASVPVGQPGSRWLREVLPTPARPIPPDQDVW